MKYILKTRKLKICTKEILKFFNFTTIGLAIILVIILIKYKPMYEVKMSGQKIGYIENKNEFNKDIQENIKNYKAKNVSDVELTSNPEYKLKLVNRTQKSTKRDALVAIQQETKIMYEYYDIYIDNKKIESVDTLEEAKNIKEEIKQKNDKDIKDIDIEIKENITENVDEIKTNKMEIAKENIFKQLNIIEEEKKEEERKTINGIKLATLPLQGKITSRYGQSSRLRKAEHTGLDIAATTGTPIKATAEGKIICAKYSGSYGNLVKIDHGNGVETWYGHASKILVKEGQQVKSGDIIANVGSTGNSTGPHLHFEIRINGKHINPQKCMY